jgi:hypothetical protein
MVNTHSIYFPREYSLQAVNAATNFTYFPRDYSLQAVNATTNYTYFPGEYCGQSAKLITFFDQVFILKMHAAVHLTSSRFHILLLINFRDNFTFIVNKMKKDIAVEMNVHVAHTGGIRNSYRVLLKGIYKQLITQVISAYMKSCY